MLPVFAKGQNAPAVHPPQKVFLLESLVGAKIVVGYLGLLGEPVPLVLFRAVIPAVGQIPGTEFLLPDGYRVQKLVVQFSVGFRFYLAHIGDVQSVAVAPECVPIVRPGHPAVLQPAKPLEHTLGENDVHVLDMVLLSPAVPDHGLAAQVQDLLEVHLMHHPLDVGQTDLKGGVDDRAAERPVDDLGVLLGDESFSVKAGDGNVHPALHPVILPGAVLGAVVFHRDDRDAPGHHHRVVHHDDTVGLVDVDPVQPCAAGKHQAVVGIELAELTVADGHVHLDAAAHLVVHILPEKGQLALAAHAARALEGEIAVHPRSQIQAHPLRAEHIPGLFLTDLLAGQCAAAVKDPGEVHVKNHIG